jgi:hypothetical protein
MLESRMLDLEGRVEAIEGEAEMYRKVITSLVMDQIRNLKGNYMSISTINESVVYYVHAGESVGVRENYRSYDEGTTVGKIYLYPDNPIVMAEKVREVDADGESTVYFEYRILDFPVDLEMLEYCVIREKNKMTYEGMLEKAVENDAATNFMHKKWREAEKKLKEAQVGYYPCGSNTPVSYGKLKEDLK